MQIKRIGLSLLLVAGLTNAFAAGEQMPRSPRDAVRAYHLQHIAIGRVALDRVALDRDSIAAQPQGQERAGAQRVRDQGFPDSSGANGEAENQANSAENGRKQGRMSPEERRALRRQIDEAGHDIYRPKR